MAKFPEYIMFKTGDDLHCAMKHTENGNYFRHAGIWSIDAKIENGKLICIGADTTSHFNGREVVAVSEEQWRKDNLGYV